jgi:hypothetical protein
VVNSSDSEFIYLYEARITTEVLRMLENPTTVRPAGWPTIERKKIPFRPFKTFRQRLVKEMLETEYSLPASALKVDSHETTLLKKALKRPREAEKDSSRTLRRKH